MENQNVPQVQRYALDRGYTFQAALEYFKGKHSLVLYYILILLP